MEIEERQPETRCVHCGERITADTYDELWGRYTSHVTDEHDKPRTVTEANRQ